MSREEARARIADAAAELVRERSFAELTVGEIMDKAGLERTIFYRHFENVGSLLLNTGRTAIDAMFAAHAKIAAAHENFDEAAIREAMTVAAEVFRRHGPILRAVFEAIAAGQLVAVDAEALRTRFDNLVAESLRDVEAKSGKRFADPEETARALNLLNENYLLDTFGREPRVSAATAAQTLSEIWITLIKP